MKIIELTDGILINGSFPDKEVLEVIKKYGDIPLICTDPPYGKIVDEYWDKEIDNDIDFAKWMVNWSQELAKLSSEGSALYVWGGYGKPNFRPFYRFIVEVEKETPWKMSNHITWKKKRAYGTKHNYLATREECAYFVLGDIKKPRMFNIPLLEEKRGYSGYNEKYPAKSEYYRRTSVWTDITEILRGKVHECQKPEKLYEIPIEVHTQRGEWTLDPFAGSGTLAVAARRLDRKFILVERDEKIFEEMYERIKNA